MPVIPAICDNCGTLFDSGFNFKNVRNVHLSGNKVSPCPNCGSIGSIPDGLYNFLDGSIELITGPKKTVNNLSRLANYIKEAKKAGKDSEEIKNDLARDYEEFNSIKDYIPKNRSELYTFLTVLIMLINLIIESDTKKKIEINSGLSKEEVEELVNDSINNSLDKEPENIDSVSIKIIEEISKADSSKIKN